MRLMVVLAAVLACAASDAAPPTEVSPNDPVSRLRSAHTLRCHFTAAATTKWTNGQRTITSENLNVQARANEVTYDSIDLKKGTARAIGNAGAADVTVKVDRMGALWMVETVPMGYLVVTTIIPNYAADSTDFIIIESRHTWLPSAYALGTQDSGTCSVLG
jgi:hypothetical protein